MNPNYYAKQKERALSRKLEIIELKGGKCEICGYSKNISALDFHHINPDEKSFQLDARHLSNTNKESIIEEVNKCILVCANCHREIHNPYFDKKNIGKIINETKSRHASVLSKKKKHVCKHCGKEFEYTTGKIYCSKECRDAAINEKYPSYEDLVGKYKELKSWEKVAQYFGITRRIIQRIRRMNE